MNPNELEQPYREALGFFEAFRKLGFSADDIYFAVNGPLASNPMLPEEYEGKCQVLVVLRAQNNEFKATCGLLDDPAKVIEDRWRDIARRISGGEFDGDHLDELWQNSLAHEGGAGLCLALAAKGFSLSPGAQLN